MNRKFPLMPACACAVVLLSGTASGAWPMQAGSAGSVEACLQQERDTLRGRMAHYKLPAASRLAREITLEIIRQDAPAVTAAVIEPGARAS